MPLLDRQIRLLGAYAVFTYPFACIPFLYFFFKDNGISLQEYMWLIAVYYWAMVAMEVPTGVLADRWGRRSSMLLGSLTLATGFACIATGDDFAWFCVGEVLFGIGHSFLSGAPTAMLFDTLKQEGRQDEFLRTESRVHALRLFGTGGSFLIGGCIAHVFGIGPTIWLTAGFCTVGATLAACLREARTERTDDKPPILKAAIRDLRSGPLVWILVYFVLLFGLLRFAFHTYQPYFEETVFDHEHPEHHWWQLGVLFAALNLVAAPCARLAPRLSDRFRYRTIFTWLSGSMCVAFFVMAALPNWLGVLFFFVHQIPFGAHWALVQEFVNQRVTAVSRATALSILSFAGRISFAALIPIVGYYEELHGTPFTYLVVGAVGSVFTILWCAPGLGTRLLGKDQHLAPARGREPAATRTPDDPA